MTTTYPDPDGVYFYNGPFSNFASSPVTLPCPFTGQALTYPTVEHRFQAMKARTEAEHDRIRLAASPGEAKALGRRTPLRPDWERIKYEVMVAALGEKFWIPEYRNALLETGARCIYEDSPTDFIWGFRSADGKNLGSNLLGRALMLVRDRLQIADQYVWKEGDVTFHR